MVHYRLFSPFVVDGILYHYYDGGDRSYRFFFSLERDYSVTSNYNYSIPQDEWDQRYVERDF